MAAFQHPTRQSGRYTHFSPYAPCYFPQRNPPTTMPARRRETTSEEHAPDPLDETKLLIKMLDAAREVDRIRAMKNQTRSTQTEEVDPVTPPLLEREEEEEEEGEDAADWLGVRRISVLATMAAALSGIWLMMLRNIIVAAVLP